MTVSLPTLYSFRRCPYAMRARMGLWASGTDVELREIVLRDKPISMLDASPKGTVPVLIFEDGTVIDESRDISQWALAKNDPDGWLANHNEAQAALIDENDGPFKTALDRYKYPNRYADEETDIPWRERGAVFCEKLDSILAERSFLAGKSIGWADHAIAPFVRQFAHVDRDWFWAQDWPHLINWLDRFLESEIFGAIMKKYNPWNEGDAPIVFQRRR